MARSVIRLAVLFALITIPAPLIAQDVSTKSDWAADWSASVGVDPTFARSFSESFMASIAREWSRTGSAVGFRAQLGAGSLSTTRTFLRAECGNCYVEGQRRFGELSAAAIYTFRREHGIRPYLLGGPALYGIRTNYSVTGATFGQPGQPGTTVWSLGATIGAGLALRVLGADLFLEQRAGFTDLSSAGPKGPVIHPFTLGIKF